MELVMAICDYLYVLDFGTLIFQGTPSEAQTSDIVRGAYLGELDEADGALSEASGR
jgi:ABC-type branched-subunit amino acid transport system ATPase component